MMAVVKVEQMDMNPRTERCARNHVRRRCCTVALAACAAPPAEKLDARDHRADRWKVNVIVAMTAFLMLRRRDRPAVRAVLRHAPLHRIGLFRQRARDATMGLSTLAGKMG